MKEKEEKARLKAKAAAIKQQKEDELKRQIMKGNEMRLELAARWAMQDEDKASPHTKEGADAEDGDTDSETSSHERIDLQDRTACCCTIS